jgi:hypothetical protein
MHTKFGHILSGVSICFAGGGDVKHTIGANVNVKGDLDWRDTTGARGMPERSNLPRRLLSFVRTRSPSYTRLVVGVSGEGLGLVRGDGGVTLDEDDHDTTGSLDTERGERR